MTWDQEAAGSRLQTQRGQPQPAKQLASVPVTRDASLFWEQKFLLEDRVLSTVKSLYIYKAQSLPAGGLDRLYYKCRYLTPHRVPSLHWSLWFSASPLA